LISNVIRQIIQGQELEIEKLIIFMQPISHFRCQKIVGMTFYNFQRSLAAILLGNLIYFAVLMPILPPVARHGLYRIDLGLVIDFVICVALYILFGRLLPEKTKVRENTHL
jgi:hypothetical protein